ncbi:paired amphipathic helix repeat-containing protein, partial [Trifolium medium]|nr:paired amphipathic helix repeat-containing protein [Trifolium medium]
INSSRTIDEAKLDKAADFMMEAQHVFQDEPGKLYEFFILLLDFRLGRIDLSVFKEGMTKLLKGHNNLIWKFNNIQPPGVTPLPLDDDGLPFKYDSAAFRGVWPVNVSSHAGCEGGVTCQTL